MLGFSINVTDIFRRRFAGRPPICLAAAFVACVTSVTPLDAADIKEGRLGEAVLEGTITSGDYDKVLSFVEARWNAIGSIYLASPGGSVTEAIKIGRLVRTLKLETIAPARTINAARVKEHKLTDPDANFMCASACFLAYIAGVKRGTEDPFNLYGPILGIHRPYLTGSELKNLSGDQAMASANQLRAMVESYLKEMNVPSKYADLMFSVPKDDVRWIDNADYEGDLEGFIPELKDWIDARCDTRTDVEKAAWRALEHKITAQMTTAEKSISERLQKKMLDLDNCSSKELGELNHQARLRMFWQPRKEALCADYHPDSRLDAKLAAALPNEPSAAVLLDAATTAAICGDHATPARTVRALAERGDARAQLGLGAGYLNGNTTTSQDKLEGVRWIRRAAEQGNDEAQVLLSLSYSLGDGIAQDYVEALKWTILALSQSRDSVTRDSRKENRESFTSKMTPAQIAEAERRASEWRPTPEHDNHAQPSAPKPRGWQFWK
jgi:hypothetical protein